MAKDRLPGFPPRTSINDLEISSVPMGFCHYLYTLDYKSILLKRLKNHGGENS